MSVYQVVDQAFGSCCVCIDIYKSSAVVAMISKHVHRSAPIVVSSTVAYVGLCQGVCMSAVIVHLVRS